MHNGSTGLSQDTQYNLYRYKYIYTLYREDICIMQCHQLYIMQYVLYHVMDGNFTKLTIVTVQLHVHIVLKL